MKFQILPQIYFKILATIWNKTGTMPNDMRMNEMRRNADAMETNAGTKFFFKCFLND
jgi:hypothetical protein